MGKFRQWHYQYYTKGELKYNLAHTRSRTAIVLAQEGNVPFRAKLKSKMIPDKTQPIKIKAIITDKSGMNYIIACLIALLIHDHKLPSESKVAPKKQFEVGTFLEGIVFDRNGFGYVSAMPDGEIYKFHPDGAPVLWAELPRPNGHKILSDGTHIVADMDEQAIIKLESDGRCQGSITHSEGVPLQRPNDITLDHSGGYYFTDQRDSYMSPKTKTGEVHYVDADGKVQVVASSLSAPNGLVLSPDGKTLYVSESRAYRIHAYSVMNPGVLKNKRILVDLSIEGDSYKPGFDGMTVDQNGIIYVATKRLGKVYVISPTGDVLRRYSSGLPIVANVAFAPDSDLLFVVGSADSARTTGGLCVLKLPGIRGVGDR